MSGIAGITTEVRTVVTDWRAFGRHVANQADSTQQADFLAGLAEAMVDAQVPYISDDIAGSNAADTIREFLQSLASMIGARA
ncbi:hypothetical protein [Phycicoccus sp. 3266]|uniref:hypothetical protein n=1 Tax=Phycicoccus sp. 3266 TaxID=2817751 RepID=UPI002864C1AB|nr:hypothetical protein [Phycicoccus sp. 3266]MDR6861941.1 hypothetical protein [Phycicoccus sp. 3266]